MISYSSAISACANRGLWEKALLLLFEMTCKRIPANDISSMFATGRSCVLMWVLE